MLRVVSFDNEKYGILDENDNFVEYIDRFALYQLYRIKVPP